MLKADSSTLKSDSDDQSRNAAPITPSDVAWVRILSTPPTIPETDALGKIFFSSSTK